MNSKKIQTVVFFFGIALILGATAYTISTQERILSEGREVILETRPVDPRDLFRGEYVILRYAIEQDDMVTTYGPRLGEGSDMYLLLEDRGDGVYQVGNVSGAIPPGSNDIWIRGEVDGFGRVRFPSLEQFYVPEGAGAPIEDLRDELHVRVSVNAIGEARIVELLDADLSPIDPFTYIPASE